MLPTLLKHYIQYYVTQKRGTDAYPPSNVIVIIVKIISYSVLPKCHHDEKKTFWNSYKYIFGNRTNTLYEDEEE